jgi:hypothetical protein
MTAKIMSGRLPLVGLVKDHVRMLGMCNCHELVDFGREHEWFFIGFTQSD